MKTKENKGVTLIALAVTIIIMLILAGVTISALTGNSGITKNAKKARDAQKNAQTLESLQLMFMDYNIGEKDEETISQYLESKVRSGDIDEFRFYIIDDELKMVIKKDERYFFVRRENEFYTVTEMGTELGEIIPGVTVVTRDEFYGLNDNSMKFRLNEDESSTLMFFDEINDPFNLEILGGNVTMYVTQDMSLTNAGMTRSAVDIHPGATLNLYICKGVTMNVDSGYGAEGTTGNALGAEGGKGGYAGIHLPEGATLNLYGKGKLIAYGGNAGTGGGSTSGNRGGGGDHACPAGGYTSGNGENSIQAGNNGMGSVGGYWNIGSSGGYYSKGSVRSNGLVAYFNQGGMWCGNTEWYRDFSGSGGTAGAGGQIYYKNLDKINAYNGDRITNKDYTTIYYEYNPDGTLTKEIAKVVQKQNGEKFIPAKIFAQAGTIRATYHTNQHMSQEECSRRGITYCGDASGKTVNVKMTNQTTTEKTQYGQGIGSGAGNLEQSNGILKPISEYK